MQLASSRSSEEGGAWRLLEPASISRRRYDMHVKMFYLYTDTTPVTQSRQLTGRVGHKDFEKANTVLR